MASMVARRIVAAVDGLSLSVIILFDYLIQDGVLPGLASKYVTSGVAAMVTVLHLVIYAAGFDLKLAREQMAQESNNKISNNTGLSTVKYTPPTAPTLDTLHIPGYMREYMNMNPTATRDVKPIVTVTPQGTILEDGSMLLNPARDNTTSAAFVKPLKSGKVVVNGPKRN
nr:MAG: VP12 [Eriocheir sinensis reovirus 1]